MKCLLQGATIYILILGPYLNLVYLIDILPHDSSVNTAPGAEGDFREIAIEYLRMTCLNGYLDYVTYMISKYFAIQKGEKFVYTVSVVMIGTQIVANYVLVSVCGLGLNGIGLAAFIGRIVPLLLSIIICVIMIRKGVFMWSGMNSEVLTGWLPMVKLGTSGTINVFAEVFLLEIATFCSQFDGEATLSVVLITFQIISMIWAVTNGLCCAATTLIGGALGEGNKADVKSYIALSIVNVLGVAIPLAIIAFCLRKQLVRIFTQDTEVLDLFYKNFWLPCFGIPLDHLQVVLNRGVLTSFGEQRFIAWSMGIIACTIGLPIIVLTIFLTDMKVSGIYLGFLAFYIANIIAPIIRMSKYNLDVEIEKTMVRVTNSTSKNIIPEDSVNGIINPLYDGTQASFNCNVEKVESMFNECVLDEPDIKMTEHENSFKEHRTVVLSSLLCAIWCAILAGVSLLKK